MHESVFEFLKEALPVDEINGKTVLEVGSYDVNGSPRLVVLPLVPKSYLGIDTSSGPGVDVIGNAENLTAIFGTSIFDVVISTELLEHVSDWRKVISEMKRTLCSSGLLVVTTRSPGFHYHAYPNDFWRFTKYDFERIFADMDILVLKDDSQAPGVFIKVRKPSGFIEVDLGVIEAMRMEI